MADGMAILWVQTKSTPTQQTSSLADQQQTMERIKSIRTLILMKLMIFAIDTQTNALAQWLLVDPVQTEN